MRTGILAHRTAHAFLSASVPPWATLARRNEADKGPLERTGWREAPALSQREVLSRRWGGASSHGLTGNAARK